MAAARGPTTASMYWASPDFLRATILATNLSTDCGTASKNKEVRKGDPNPPGGALESRSSRPAALGQALLQDRSLWSVPIGSEPQLDDPDTLLTTDPPSLDKLPLPNLPSSIPAILTGLPQLPTPVVVVCPIINPTRRCSGCGFSMSDRMMPCHFSSQVEPTGTPV